MADSEPGNMFEESIPALEEISSMKVTDLKKKLRGFGLPITGNKTDLIERLTGFCMSNNKGIESFESSSLSFDESQISEEEGADGNVVTMEDNALLDQEHFSSYIDSSLDDSKVLTSSENKLNSTEISTVAKPLKKRTIIRSNEESVPPKKVVINRTSIAHTEISMKPTSTTKQEIVITNDQSETDKKRLASVKNLSVAERMAIRAKRFNMSNTAVSSTTTTTKLTNVRNSKLSIISAPVTTDIEILKKRAERFGQNVSTVLKQIEQKEKLLKRKCKFGASLAASATSSVDGKCEQELPDAEEQVEPTD